MLKKTMKAGDMKVLYTPKMSLTIWKDKKIVRVLSTVLRPEMITTQKQKRNGDYIKKPNVVLLYNENMGGVDLGDQLIQPYATTGQSIKYYIKIFFRLFDTSILNSYVVYKSFRPELQMQFLDFWIQLVKQLIYSHNTLITHSLARNAQSQNLSRLTDKHFPELISEIPDIKSKRLNCLVCYKHRKVVKTKFYASNAAKKRFLFLVSKSTTQNLIIKKG